RRPDHGALAGGSGPAVDGAGPLWRGELQLLPRRQLRLSSPPHPARGPVPADRCRSAPGGTAAVGMALSTRTAAMAAAVEKVEVLRTRLRAEAPSRSSASCSPSRSGSVAPASRAVSVSRAAKACL